MTDKLLGELSSQMAGPDKGRVEPALDAMGDDQVIGAFVDSLAAFDESLTAGSVKKSLFDSTLENELDDAELKKAMACLLFLEQLWPRAGTPLAEALPRDSVQSVANGDEPAAAVESGRNPPHDRHLGKFRIERELGRGGGGIVFLAKDTQLNRSVALKVPQPDFFLTPELIRRFQQEAQAAAGLHHPAIVPVLEAGFLGPIFFIAYEYCAGPTLAQWLQDRRQPLSWTDAARIVATLADAVEHAHSRGILHRDIKPSNILLEAMNEATEFLPRLTDFGLAKLLDSEGSVTRSGTVAGTSEYMAPEQADGRLEDLGPETDIYAMGVVLYELLTGQPPFHGPSRVATMYSVMREPPRRPCRSQHSLPRDLEAVCLKCLEKEPKHRYPSSAALAEDLRRFLAGTPTVARPSGPAQRIGKWVRRKPVVAALTLLASMLLVFLSAGTVWHGLTLGRANETAAKFERQVEQDRRVALRHEYAACVRGAYQAWQNNEVSGAIELLDRCLPNAGEQDMRGFEWYYVRKLCDGGLRTLRGHRGPVHGVAFSPDGNRVASCGLDGTIRVWDPADGRLIATQSAHAEGAWAIEFSPNGQLLASAGHDSRVKLWDAKTLTLQTALEGHVGDVTCLAFSPAGDVLATGGADHTIKIWDVLRRSERDTIRGHSGTVNSLSFSADGYRMASGSDDGTAKVWDLRSPRSPLSTSNRTGAVYAVALSADGSTLITSGVLVERIAGSEKHQPILLPGHSDHVRSLRISPDGRTLVSASDDATIRVWDLIAKTSRHIYRAHTRQIFSVAYSPKGDLLASASKDGTIRIWDPSMPQDRKPVHQFFPRDHAISSDGHTLAVANWMPDKMSRIKLWNLATGSQIGAVELPFETIHQFMCARCRLSKAWNRTSEMG